MTETKRNKKGSEKKTEERQTEKLVEKKKEALEASGVEASKDDSWNYVGIKSKKAKEE